MQSVVSLNFRVINDARGVAVATSCMPAVSVPLYESRIKSIMESVLRYSHSVKFQFIVFFAALAV